MVQMQFNAQGIEPEFGGFSQDPIWADGWNKVIIVGDRVVELGNNQGKMLAMEIRSQEGPDAGKTGTVMCSVWHNDPAKRDRAIQQMAAICFAVGRGGYNDTQEIWNLPFWIENKAGRTRKGNDGKEYPTNSFQNVRNLAGVEPGKVAAQGGAPGYAAPALPPMAPPAPPAPPTGQPAGWGAPPAGQPPATPAWGAPPGNAPAAPSFAPPPAPGGAPAWQAPPAPTQGQPPAFQPPAGPPPAQGWQPQQGGQPPAAPAWGQPR